MRKKTDQERGQCPIAGCDKPIKAKGLCKRHYQQQWATGSPEIKRPNPRGTPEERFWRYVTQGAPDECWLWQGQLDKDGYGVFRADPKKPSMRAHRFAYELKHGPIPPEFFGRHTCNTTACCNWAHVIPGTHLDNMADRKAAGHYPAGEQHPNVKFSDAVVAQVLAWSGTNRTIARELGISQTQVGNIKRGLQRTTAV